MRSIERKSKVYACDNHCVYEFSAELRFCSKLDCIFETFLVSFYGNKDG